MKRRPRVPPPVPPRGPIATYTKLLRSIERYLNGGIRAAFERETGVWIDGPADDEQSTVSDELIKRLMLAITQLVKNVLSRKDLVKTLAEVALRTDKVASENIVRQVRAVRGIDPAQSDPLKAVLVRFRDEQINMIRSLADEKRRRVRKVLEEHRGARVRDAAKRLREETGVSRSKAELIARDQVLRFNASLTRERHTAAGITEYVWATSGDERVRPGHARLNGRRFRYADPPVVDESGRRANPGDDYQCRCVAVPVIPD